MAQPDRPPSSRASPSRVSGGLASKSTFVRRKSRRNQLGFGPLARLSGTVSTSDVQVEIHSDHLEGLGLKVWFLRFRVEGLGFKGQCQGVTVETHLDKVSPGPRSE